MKNQDVMTEREGETVPPAPAGWDYVGGGTVSDGVSASDLEVRLPEILDSAWTVPAGNVCMCGSPVAGDSEWCFACPASPTTYFVCTSASALGKPFASFVGAMREVDNRRGDGLICVHQYGEGLGKPLCLYRNGYTREGLVLAATA